MSNDDSSAAVRGSESNDLLGLAPNAVNKAVHEAVSAIYFCDSSDYLPALWSVVRLLAPDMAEMLEKDERQAWQTSDDRANARPNVVVTGRQA